MFHIKSSSEHAMHITCNYTCESCIWAQNPVHDIYSKLFINETVP